MEIILKADVSGLGEEGDIKKVAPGYARNYLLPKGLALPKNATNLRWLEKQTDEINKRKEEKALAARDLAEKIADLSINVTGKVSSGNRLYGSIHAHDISLALKELGVEIDARKIEVGEPIKYLGDFTVTVKLYEGVQAKLKVKVSSIHDQDSEETPADKKTDEASTDESASVSDETSTDESASVSDETSADEPTSVSDEASASEPASGSDEALASEPASGSDETSADEPANEESSTAEKSEANEEVATDAKPEPEIKPEADPVEAEAGSSDESQEST